MFGQTEELRLHNGVGQAQIDEPQSRQLVYDIIPYTIKITHHTMSFDNHNR